MTEASLTGSSLPTAILFTLAYYDTFDYPLTAEEVWRWLYQAPGETLGGVTRENIQPEVDNLVQQKKLERRGAYVVFPGREEIVASRAERTVRSEKLWRRAASTARYLELVPFVKMIAVVNTLAISNVRSESDIDLLIVTAPRHIWIARMMVTFIVSLLGYRRHGNKIAGRICLSFYVTTDGMDFSKLKSTESDTHFAYWTAQAVPLIDDGTYDKYRQANSWVKTILPNAWAWEWKTRLLVPNTGLQLIKQFYQLFFSTPIGHWFEAFARDRQVKKMDQNMESKAKLGTTDVVITEDILKFHEMDRRTEYNTRFQQRLTELGLK